MNIINFILKKIYKNKLNIIPFLLIFIFIVFIYASYNFRTFHTLENPRYSGEEKIEQLEGNITDIESLMEILDESSSYYEECEQRLKFIGNRINFYQQRLKAVEEKDWHEYYKNDLEITKSQLLIFEADTTTDNEDALEVLNVNQKFTQYMLDYGSGFDDRFANIQGITFLAKTFAYYTPFLLPLLLIYIVSFIYCSAFIDKINIQRLFPISFMKLQGTKMLSGVIIGIFAVLFISMIAVISGTLGNTLGNLNSPVLTYTLEGANSYVSFISIFPQFLVLLMLAVIFIVNVISVVSIFSHKQMTCMLISLFIIIGGVTVTINVAQLQPYLHLLPTSYLYSFQVVSGELAFTTGNVNVNFINGVINLSIMNIVLVLIYYYVSKLLSKGKLNSLK